MSPSTRTDRRLRVLGPALLALLVGAGCSGGDEESPETGGAAGPARSGSDGDPVQATGTAGGAGMRFTDVTAGSGLTLRNVSGDPVAKMAIPENIGQGAAALDFDGDGRLDLFAANGDAFAGTSAPAERRCALYRNLGDLRFESAA